MSLSVVRDISFALLLLTGSACLAIAEGSPTYMAFPAAAALFVWMRAYSRKTWEVSGYVVIISGVVLFAMQFLAPKSDDPFGQMGEETMPNVVKKASETESLLIYRINLEVVRTKALAHA